jgi:hypothetical protein
MSPAHILSSVIQEVRELRRNHECSDDRRLAAGLSIKSLHGEQLPNLTVPARAE